ncbi:hypothetical protein [Nocardioides massiliensis]|uniref:Htaa domain-containing protein n=1 Tax=Nocardioides massiliensis TaxID=1325935 RepID=A0ABT9NRL6_9ACTN|nr:hypothetical protein [Nocardioides massiliensis]MDP9823077.1 hypothetical protein [Nocardioides massiliensis]
MTTALPRRWAALAGAAVLALVALTVVVPPWAAAEEESAGVSITGATLTWALNDEIGNAGFAPGTRNFLHAGEVPNPGRGGWQMPKSAWRSAHGNVTIEKPDAGGTYREATWEGLATTPQGEPVLMPFDGGVSKIRVRIDEGTGWYDPTTGRASLGWDATFGVVSYSGLSFFNVSGIRLEVRADGSGVVTASLAGYEGSPSDADVWNPIPPTSVVLAELPKVELSATGAEGSSGSLRATPAYTGVTFEPGGAAAKQVRTGTWGAWPRSFVRFQERLGTAEYWYSTGAATDRLKVAQPLAVTFTVGDETTVPGPSEPVPVDPDPVDPGPGKPGTPSEPTDPTPAPPGGGPKAGKQPFTVKNAQLRWGMSREAGNAAHLPGTVNLFSAGELPKGSSPLAQREWRARAGAVRIEKRSAAGDYRLATWGGLSTTATGASVAPASSDAFSDHQVVIDHGSGRVDPARKSATIRWSGRWSVAFYSGLTRFTVADPELRVRNGRGRLWGTLSGYAGSREDAVSGEESVLTPIPSKRVVLADLGAVRVDRARGFVVTPRYDRVRYDASGANAAQVRTGPWGSFPAGFIDWLEPAGVSGFWYSTGGSTDRLKAALPVSVSYRASAPVAQPKPEQTPTPEPVPTPDPLPSGGNTGVPTTSGAPEPATATGPALAPLAAGLPALATPFYGGQAESVTARPMALRSAAAPSSAALPWALGTAFLALAVALALTTPRTSARR